MGPIHIAGLFILTMLYRWVLPDNLRQWFLLIASILGIYWFQYLWVGSVNPTVIIYPTVILVLLLLVWWLIRPAESVSRQEDQMTFMITLLVTIGIVFFLDWFRQNPRQLRSYEPMAIVLLTMAAIVTGTRRRNWTRQTFLLLTSMGILTIVGLFVVLKQPALNTLLFSRLSEQAELSQTPSIQWIGFSYVAFRLIHVLRDTQTDKLQELTLRQYLTYVIFYPAYLSGPIDRFERFDRDYKQLDHETLPPSQLVEGGRRVLIGMFKKFVIADTLASFALSTYSIQSGQGILWTWFTLYSYAFQLFFDFSGYTDIAIGLGLLAGLKLPENFDRPYLKRNLTSFWQSWHITLSSWVRFYVFIPLARRLLKTKQIRRSPRLVLLISHITTMAVVGLWHGITWNFAIWGVWHGIGLFIHKVWSDSVARWFEPVEGKPRLKQTWTVVGVFLTFHYVLLSWVWFALPDPITSIQTFRNLLGV